MGPGMDPQELLEMSSTIMDFAKKANVTLRIGNGGGMMGLRSKTWLQD